MIRWIFIGVLVCLGGSCFAQHWSALDGWPNRFITSLYADTVNDKLYFGGDFSQVNGLPIRGIASWNGTHWDSLGAGMDEFNSSFPNNTYAINRYNNEIIAGGGFTEAGNLFVNYLVRWNGTAWNAMPGGQPNTGGVADIEVFNNELYVCGGFDSIGTIPASRVAKWNGAAWQSIGTNYNFPGTLSRIQFYHGNLYVSGNFLDPQGNHCYLAKWNGSTWQFFTNDGPHGFWCQICDMEVLNDKLYVGGMFFTSGGCAGNCLISWNDTTWSAVGGSVQVGPNNPYPTITDLCVNDGKLYCAGNFEKIGGVPAEGLARWDGYQWCTYGTMFNAGINYLEIYHDTIYVGGGFIQLDTVQVKNLAKWTGGNYTDTCGVISTGIAESEISSFSIFPNPANDQLTIRLNDGFSKNSSLRILNSLGQIVLEKELSAGEKTVVIDIAGFAEGIYFLNITGEKSFVSQKLIIRR